MGFQILTQKATGLWEKRVLVWKNWIAPHHLSCPAGQYHTTYDMSTGSVQCPQLNMIYENKDQVKAGFEKNFLAETLLSTRGQHY